MRFLPMSFIPQKGVRLLLAITQDRLLGKIFLKRTTSMILICNESSVKRILISKMRLTGSAIPVF